MAEEQNISTIQDDMSNDHAYVRSPKKIPDDHNSVKDVIESFKNKFPGSTYDEEMRILTGGVIPKCQSSHEHHNVKEWFPSLLQGRTRVKGLEPYGFFEEYNHGQRFTYNCSVKDCSAKLYLKKVKSVESLEYGLYGCITHNHDFDMIERKIELIFPDYKSAFNFYLDNLEPEYAKSHSGKKTDGLATYERYICRRNNLKGTEKGSIQCPSRFLIALAFPKMKKTIPGPIENMPFTIQGTFQHSHLKNELFERTSLREKAKMIKEKKKPQVNKMKIKYETKRYNTIEAVEDCLSLLEDDLTYNHKSCYEAYVLFQRLEEDISEWHKKVTELLTKYPSEKVLTDSRNEGEETPTKKIKVDTDSENEHIQNEIEKLKLRKKIKINKNSRNENTDKEKIIKVKKRKIIIENDTDSENEEIELEKIRKVRQRKRMVELKDSDNGEIHREDIKNVKETRRIKKMDTDSGKFRKGRVKKGKERKISELETNSEKVKAMKKILLQTDSE